MHVLNLDDLPEFARKELLDFHQFLKQKYAPENTTTKQPEATPLAPRLVKPFTPLSRDELYER